MPKAFGLPYHVLHFLTAAQTRSSSPRILACFTPGAPGQAVSVLGSQAQVSWWHMGSSSAQEALPLGSPLIHLLLGVRLSSQVLVHWVGSWCEPGSLQHHGKQPAGSNGLDVQDGLQQRHALDQLVLVQALGNITDMSLGVTGSGADEVEEEAGYPSPWWARAGRAAQWPRSAGRTPSWHQATSSQVGSATLLLPSGPCSGS